MFPLGVRNALAKRTGVTIEPGWGKGNLAAKYAGKIFLMQMKDTLVFKLPKERVAALLSEGRGVAFDPRKNGRVMKEWVVLPQSYRDVSELIDDALRLLSKSLT
jgi:hypothetical protein